MPTIKTTEQIIQTGTTNQTRATDPNAINEVVRTAICLIAAIESLFVS